MFACADKPIEHLVTWIARRNTSLDELLAEMKLKRTRNRRPTPEARLNGLELPGAWSLVLNNFSNDDEPAFGFDVTQQMMGQEGLNFYTNDRSGMSVIFGRRDGKDDWSVLYDPQKDAGSLSTLGQPPAALAPILDAADKVLGSDGGAARLRDVPAALGQTLIGFRHDQSPQRPYYVLRKKKLGIF